MSVSIILRFTGLGDFSKGKRLAVTNVRGRSTFPIKEGGAIQTHIMSITINATDFAAERLFPLSDSGGVEITVPMTDDR